MYTAAQNLFKDKETLARYRLENEIDENLDSRIVVADVMVVFYRRVLESISIISKSYGEIW